MTKNPWLQEPILNYIRAADGTIDSIYIWSHFKLTPDIIFPEIGALVKDHKLRRIEWGNRHHYEAIV